MVLSMIGVAIIFIPGLMNFGMKNVSDKSDKKHNVKENESDAPIHLWDMRVNRKTGTIDIADVDAARQQARNMAYGANSERMKSGVLNLQWQELGPDNIGGRTRAILIDKNNPSLMFAGGISGGLWRSTTHGGSWVKVNDTASSLMVSCITQAANGDIYYGTGEALVNVANGTPGGGFEGEGIWKSTDGGNTFHRLPSTWGTGNMANFKWVNNMGADPVNSQRIYAATVTGLWISKDGGTTWKIAHDASGSSFNGANVTTVKVGTDGTVACSKNGKIYVSPNGNDSTYAKISSLPVEGRTELAISPSNPNIMYACVGGGSNNGLYNIYQSTDKFATATVIGPGGGAFDPLGTQQYYANTIAVAPNNPNKIFVAGLNVWEWTQGQNWNQINGFYLNTYVHADQHTIIFNPQNANDFFIGTDGGIFESQDQGMTFSAMNRNYNVTQFYSVAPSPVQGSFGVIGGSQDNGDLYISGLGNSNQDAISIYGNEGNGDGFNTAISQYNPTAFFFEAQYGMLYRSSSQGSGGVSFFDDHINPSAASGCMGPWGEVFLPCFSNWFTPFTLWENLNPTKPLDTSFFIGVGSGVWVTKKALDFSVNPKWYKVSNGNFQGLPTAMACTFDGKTVFVGTDGGKIYRLTNLDYVNDNLDTTGTNYNLSTFSNPIVQTLIQGTGQYCTSISVDPKNANHIVVTYGNYGSSVFIYQSHNALSASPTFTNIQGSLPLAPIYSSLIDGTDSSRIITGSEMGIYSSDNGGQTWTWNFNGVNGELMPIVPAFMLKQLTQYSNGVPATDVYAGTYGRGFFKTNSIPLGINTVASQKPQINLYPNPSQNIANINYSMNTSNSVSIDIYNVEGQKVKAVVLGNQSSGSHNYSVNVSGLSNGTYFLNLITGNENTVTKFVISR